MTKEKDLWVHSYRMPPDSNNSIKMEVGIEDCLHIEFEYNKSKCVTVFPSFSHPVPSPYSHGQSPATLSLCSRPLNGPLNDMPIRLRHPLTDTLHRYHLKDVIVGKIYFLLVRIKIKHMELSIIRRETTGSPPNQYNESETITKFEIMDGAPVRGGLPSLPRFLSIAHLSLALGKRD